MWEEIIRSFTEFPRDVQSGPLTKRPGLWFYICVADGTLYVDCTKEHQPSSNLSQRRRLAKSTETCDVMHDIYCRRKRGEPISAEATSKTVNQVYWYGIFADMGY